MLTKYKKETGITIDPIIISDQEDSSQVLQSLLKGNNAPDVYVASPDSDAKWLSDGGFAADFNTISKNAQGNDLPYAWDGYGLVFDRAMFDEIFGANSTELIKALKNANYEDWVSFIAAMNNYINNRTGLDFSINGKSYSFPGTKGELTKDLNGVFAIAGADSNIYGRDILNTVLPTADMAAWKNVKGQSPESAMPTLDSTLTTYVEGLDMMTTYLSGTYRAGIRGTDFVDSNLYSVNRTQKMFMDGKSVFTIADSRDYNKLAALNAKKAQTLEYLPIKMPYDSNQFASYGGAKLNSSIPAEISYSLYINAKSSQSVQKKALDFLEWLKAHENTLGNPLSDSVKAYIQSSNSLEYDYTSSDIDSWKTAIFGNGGMSQFLQEDLWTQEYKNEIKLYLTKMWCGN